MQSLGASEMRTMLPLRFHGGVQIRIRTGCVSWFLNTRASPATATLLVNLHACVVHL